MKATIEIDHDATSHGTKTEETFRKCDTDPEMGIQDPESLVGPFTTTATRVAVVRQPVSQSSGQARAVEDDGSGLVSGPTKTPNRQPPARNDPKTPIDRPFPEGREEIDNRQLPPTPTARSASDRCGVVVVVFAPKRNTTDHRLVTAASMATSRKKSSAARPEPVAVGHLRETCCKDLQRKGRQLSILVVSILFCMLWIAVFWLLTVLT